MARTLLQFFLITFGVSAVWEAAQTPLYQSTTLLGMRIHPSLFDPHYLRILAYVTCGDVFYISLIYALVACLEHDIFWIKQWRLCDTIVILVAGFAFATAVEWRGLAAGHWSYSALMPIIPYLHVGLSPFVQLAITAHISLYFLRQIFLGKMK